MKGITRCKRLIIKEIKEQWIIGIGIFFCSLFYSMSVKPSGEMLTGMKIVAEMWGFPLLILCLSLGVRLASSEIRQGTLPFILTKPISRSLVLTTKYIAGIFTILACIGIALIFRYSIHRFLTSPSIPENIYDGIVLILLKIFPEPPKLFELAKVHLLTLISWYTAIFFLYTWHPGRRTWLWGLSMILLTNMFIKSFFATGPDLNPVIIFSLIIIMFISSLANFERIQVK